ncbi:large conductance mechanosensitive channel protein MscL [Streptomyces sp. NPDC005012]|uniref:large conductance mechanosensitive channel protein MscL n=1 Tax=unclassified Streptomyces TaxID=2593676 RepID=UPI0033A03774
MSEEKVSVLEGFKAFLMRGNVIDMAVAVVIGAAFTNIVNKIVEGVINPLVGAFGTMDLARYSSCVKGDCTKEGQGVEIMWGLVLSATLTFLITAAVVYFLMVLPMSRVLARQAARRKAKEAQQALAAEPVTVTELEVLQEIRDALVRQRPDGTAANSTVVSPR